MISHEPEKAVPKIPEEWYRAMIQTAIEGIWLIDADARTLYANDRMAALLGTTTAEMSGRTVYEFVFPEERDEHLERIRHNLYGTSEAFDARFLRKDGSEVWVMGNTHPLPDSQGKIVGALGMFTDVTQRRRIEQALRKSEEALQQSNLRFRRLVESNIVGIAVSDLSGAIHEANDVYLKMLGYTREELLAGKVRWDTATVPEYREADTQAVQSLLATGVAGPFEKAYHRKDGSQVPVMVGVVLFDEKQGLTLSIVLDISERKELERRKDEFVSFASHELRNPLAVTKGQIELAGKRLQRFLQKGGHTEETIAALNNVAVALREALRSVSVQQRLIGDFLDVTRIQANTLEISLQRCDLVSIVREAVERQHMLFPTRVMQLDLPSAPVPVLADADRIGQVVTNYLINAIKYAPEDQPIHIGLRAERCSARVCVQDHGPGLSSEAQAHLWERFYRTAQGKAQRGALSGMGLGLYICRTLVTLHHGQVGVQSEPGQGSTFWFTLPLAPDDPAPAN